MVKAVTRRDLLWGYLAQILNIGAGLLLLPLILITLSKADVGLWFVFVTLASLAQLLEFGFQPTIARNAAYVYSGAKMLTKEGLPEDAVPSGMVEVELLGDLLATSRFICRVVAIVAAFVLVAFGSVYIYSIITPEQSVQKSILAWLLFSIGYLINFYFSYINGFLQGRGDVGKANQVVVLSRSILVVLGSLALFLGFGLVGLGASVLISALLGRVLALYFFLNHVASKQAVLRVAKCSRPLLKKLWHNAGRLGIVQVGAFLIQRGNILIASSFLGLEAASSYSLSVTILMSLSAVSSVVCQLQVPHVSALQVRGARGELIGIYGEMVLLSGFVFAVGAITITLFGNFFLSGIGSQVSLLSFNHMVVLGLVLMLELHHSVAATYLTTLNIVPFVKAGVLSGIAVLALSLLLIQPFGMLGLIISQGMTQILYNNWKWPLEVLRSLRAGFAETLFSGGGRFVRKFFKVG